ncbi:MAG: hypothetical protein V3V01_20260, partial [Acidimicrobiales bacterium]
LLAVLLATFWVVKQRGLFGAVRTEVNHLFGAVLTQGALGYVQFFTGVPVLLVALHILGSVAVWVAVIRFHLRVGSLTKQPSSGRPLTAPASMSSTP